MLEIYETLLCAASWNLLHFDLSWQERTDTPPAKSVNWLDFTHAITFSHAVKSECTKAPELWTAGLLQIACFIGRGNAFSLERQETERWEVGDEDKFMAQCMEKLLDHGINEPIVVAHLVKNYCAMKCELNECRSPETRKLLTQSYHRFMLSPFKRKHLKRNVKQAIDLVAKDF